MRTYSYYSFLIIIGLFFSISAESQSVRIAVSLGKEPAEYAFVMRNSRYIGSCDSLGILIVDKSVFDSGDTLSAMFAGIRSNNKLVKDNNYSYNLKVEMEAIATSKIESREANLFNEYIKLISRIKYHTILYGDKYNMTYERSEYCGDSLTAVHKGITTLALMHRQRSKDDVYWEKFNSETDSLETAWAAFGLNYANQILMMLSSKKVLKEYYNNKRLLIHKTISENGGLSYIFLEGDNRDNQTMIRLNDKGSEICEVSRSFLGSGSLIVSSNRSLHTVKITLKAHDKVNRLDKISIEAFIPDGMIHYSQSYSDIEFLGR